MEYVWYAAYGSNLSADRLSKYLEGGQAEGSSRPERGARNPAAPTDTDTFTSDHQLYFALESSKWDGGGVAFMSCTAGATNSGGAGARFRLHRVTLEQFQDIYAQENRLPEPVAVDVQALDAVGQLDLTDRLYGRLMLLATHTNDEPIITFTTASTLTPNQPQPAYLRAISVGLKEGFGLTESEIAEYLSGAPGMEKFGIGSWPAVFETD